MPDAPFTDQPLKASSDPLDASLAAFSGIGPKRGEVLARRGLQTFRDALFHIPVRYQDLRRRDRIRDLLPGTTALVAGRLLDFKTRPMRQMRGRRIATATLTTPACASPGSTFMATAACHSAKPSRSLVGSPPTPRDASRCSIRSCSAPRRSPRFPSDQ